MTTKPKATTNKGKTTTRAVSAPDPLEVPIRRQLRQRLLALSYHAFAECVCLLLMGLGYEDAHVAGRTEWKGRNRAGGYDIEASLPAGVGRRKVVIQVKQFDTLPVYQRSVDELRGACLRAGAAEALLITTSTFSPVVLRNADAITTPIAPVRLMDGAEVLDLLILHRIGVWEEASDSPSRPGRIGLDDAFFDELSRTYVGNGRYSVPQSHDSKEMLSWLLTIQVDLPGSTGERTQAREENK